MGVRSWLAVFFCGVLSGLCFAATGSWVSVVFVYAGMSAGAMVVWSVAADRRASGVK